MIGNCLLARTKIVIFFERSFLLSITNEEIAFDILFLIKANTVKKKFIR
jgi:hypothetical protein